VHGALCRPCGEDALRATQLAEMLVEVPEHGSPTAIGVAQ
jgi:hypothetical protein